MVAQNSTLTIPANLPTDNSQTLTAALFDIFPPIMQLFKEKINEDSLRTFTNALRGLLPYEDLKKVNRTISFEGWKAAYKKSPNGVILEELYLILEDILTYLEENYSIRGSSYFGLAPSMLLLLSFRRYQASFSSIKYPNFSLYKLKALFQIYRGIRDLTRN